MELTTNPAYNQETFDAFTASREEPDWLREQRQNAWANFCERSWPSRNEEEWRRTDIRLFHADKFTPAPQTETSPTTSHSLLDQGVGGVPDELVN